MMLPRLSRFTGRAILLASTGLLGACSSLNTSSIDQAERMEVAMQRQQAEPEKPAIDNRLVYLDMIKTMQARSLYFASLAHIDAYQKAHGSSPEILRLQADAFRATGQDDAAEKQYRQLLTTTEAAAAWHGLGLLAAQHGDYIQAISSLRESNRLDPINANVLSDLGYALLQTNDLAAARLPLIQAAELDSDNRKIISNLALYLLLSGDGQKAESLMMQANIPSETRTEIARRAQMIRTSTLSGSSASEQTLAAADNGGMQLQLQWQLMAPKGKSQRAE